MGDSSGLLEISSNGENEVNSVSAALGGSVSFGRFLSESLDWGRWSSFCQRRHLEEIEKCSTPGSVAQKKAYFEAHYKKAAAARRSASLLEQANVVAASSAERNDESSEGSCNLRPVLGELCADVTPDEAAEEGSPKSAKETNSSIAEPSIADGVENQNRVNDMEEHNRDNSLEKRPLKESSIVNQETRDSSEKKKRVSFPKSTGIHRPPRLPTSPAPKLCSPAKSVSSSFKSTPTSKKYGSESSEKKKSTMGALHVSSQGRKGAIIPTTNRTSTILKKVEESKVSSGRGPKSTPKTPNPELGRGRTVLDQRLSGRAKVDEKLHRDSVDYNSIRKYRDENFITGNQLQAQTASPSLSLRTVERAEKRKEIPHNLEDKFCGREAKKLQFREIPKEKAESEIKKLRQSLNFKARPLPAFYHSPELSKIEKRKVQLTRPQSPKLGRTNSSRANSSAASLPPTQSSIKGDQTTGASGKSSQALRSKYEIE